MKLHLLLFALLALLAACATPTPTAVPTNCAPDRVRIDPALGKFQFEWNQWDGSQRIYKVGRSTFKLKIENGYLYVHLDAVSGEKNVLMAQVVVRTIDIMVIPMASTNQDGSLTIQYFAITHRCGVVYFDDHATKTN